MVDQSTIKKVLAAKLCVGIYKAWAQRYEGGANIMYEGDIHRLGDSVCVHYGSRTKVVVVGNSLEVGIARRYESIINDKRRFDALVDRAAAEVVLGIRSKFTSFLPIQYALVIQIIPKEVTPHFYNLQVVWTIEALYDYDVVIEWEDWG
jgi:hypothetical protein